MRLLSVRLIVSLVLGITLVSSGFSYYEVLGQKRALRSDLERRDEILGESLVGNVEGSWRVISETTGSPTKNSRNWCNASATASTCWVSSSTTGKAPW